MNPDLIKFLTIMQLLPGIFSAVVAVEHAGPWAPGAGAAKLDLVLNVVGTAARATPSIALAIDAKDLADATAMIAATTVQTMNAAGLFNTSQKQGA